MLREPLLDVSVVLPTYNESASLPLLIPRILDALHAAGLRGEVIVVDDNSPDGTAETAEELGRALPVRTLKRTHERGLATAVLTGFRLSQASVCVVMDADGSHPVQALGEMVHMILADKAEIVVGSRHVPGGGSKDWPLFSQLKSRFAASLALGLTAMTDPTTGFMAVRRTLLDKLELDPVGWKIVLEIAVKAHPARIAEVPIVFVDRQAGESKQSLKVLGHYLTHLYKLYKFRFPAFIEFLKFCLVGLIGLFVDLSTVALLKHTLALDTRLCQLFGFSAAVTFNYTANRHFSFEHARSTPWFESYVTYIGANLVGLVLRMLTIHVLMLATALDRGRGYLLLSLIGIGVATAVNFLGAKYLAFAPRPSARERVESLAPPAMARSAAPAAWLLSGLAVALVTFANLTQSAQRTTDELVNVAMATDILRGFEDDAPAAAQPAQRTPLQRGDTPVYPLLLATFGRLGPQGMALLPPCALAVFLWACFAATKPLRREASGAAVMLAASAPWLVKPFALLSFGPLVATSAAAGFALLVRSEGPRRLLFAALSGLCVGLGFAIKPWLVLPGLFACLAYLVARSYEGGLVERARWMRAAFAFSGGVLCGAGSHLAFVALTAPADLHVWIQDVYLGLFGRPGAAGTPEGELERAGSTWDYARFLLRDHGALVVPLTLGLPAFTRRMNVSGRAFAAAVVGAVLALVPLSIPADKDPLHMIPVLPFVYGLAGLTVISPDYTPSNRRRVDRAAARASLGLAALFGAGFVVEAVWGEGLSALELGVHLGHVAVWCAPSLRVLQRKPVSPLLLPCALTSFGLAALLTLGAPRGLFP